MQSVKKCRRVVVTGLGMITPLGFTVENNWNNILKGETNFQKLSSEGFIFEHYIYQPIFFDYIDSFFLIFKRIQTFSLQSSSSN